MKQFRLFFFVLGFTFLAPAAFAGDTTWVQTYTFDSLWTRRAKFYFPTANQNYRKILMYFTIKCYNGLSGDGKYPCGEWDYIYFNQVFDHRGKLDSTLKRGRYFRVEGAPDQDSLRYSPQPQYDIYRSHLYNTVVDNIITANDYTVGTASSAMPYPFNLATGDQRTQFTWKAGELIAAGLTAGNITGIKLNFQGNAAVISNLRIRLKQVTQDSFDVRAMNDDTLAVAYHFNRVITTAGWNNFQFSQPFTWDGSSNILVDFSYDNPVPGAANQLMGQATPNAQGLFSTTGNYSVGSFQNKGGNIRFDKALNMFGGNSPRTYELWVKVDSFQGQGGIFSSGLPTNNGEFSFIAMGTNNHYKFGFWTNDVLFNGPNMKDVWKHLAVTFGNDTLRIYLNGTLVKEEVRPNANTIDKARDFLLGQWADENYGRLLGKLSHLRIWDKVLSPAQIKEWVGRDVTASHPEYSHLKADYRINNGTGSMVQDLSPLNQPAGFMNGNLWWKPVKPADYYYNAQKLYWRPQIRFERNTYTSHTDSVLVNDTVYNQPTLVNFYENPDGNHVINDNDPANPALLTSSRGLWTHPYTYVYQNGMAIDSFPNALDSVLYNHDLLWYSNLVAYEIGRSISPYGINLNLGTGRTRVYDLTDYYPILQDTVDLEVGSTQEVQDVRFAFIKGDPPAAVNKISQPWGKGVLSLQYSAIASDAVLAPMTLTLAPNTDQVKLRSYISGHGGAENSGPSYPNGCCEFMYNDHYYKSNGQVIYPFRIQREDCGLNPIYPQGGTWVYDREGWCPGDIIVGHDFNVTSFRSGNEINLDYHISPIPSGGGNVGNGYYRTGLQLIEYKTPGRNTDAEVYDIRKPSDAFVLSRINPICTTPQVVLRNTGRNPLTAASVRYKVSGGQEEVYSWTGQLQFLDTAVIDLPISGPGFWTGDNSKTFIARVASANGGTDEYAGNDTAFSYYNIPDVFPMNKIIIRFRTNNRPEQNDLTIKDFNGNVVLHKSGLSANTTYDDTLNLPHGCYTMVLNDAGNDGLKWWATPSQGSGTISILNGGTSLPLKTFNPDFGAQIFYTFSLQFPVSVSNTVLASNTRVFPNPGTGDFVVQAEGFSGKLDIILTNVAGQVILTDQMECYGSVAQKQFQTRLPAGVYLLQLRSGPASGTHKLIIR